ncbi:MAG: succinylglutamate desuccinylase/aspartoacylase family protein, partial [Bryobacteraceae bacterium]
MKTGWRTLGPVDVFECHGVRKKPRVVIAAGIHGDEYEGPAAVARVAQLLRPEDLSGAVACVPVANPSAFAAAQRTTPEDGMNLAR